MCVCGNIYTCVLLDVPEQGCKEGKGKYGGGAGENSKGEGKKKTNTRIDFGEYILRCVLRVGRGGGRSRMAYPYEVAVSPIKINISARDSEPRHKARLRQIQRQRPMLKIEVCILRDPW